MDRKRKLQAEDLGPPQETQTMGKEMDPQNSPELEISPEKELDLLKDRIRKSQNSKTRRALMEQIGFQFGNKVALRVSEELKLDEEPDVEEEPEEKETSDSLKKDDE